MQIVWDCHEPNKNTSFEEGGWHPNVVRIFLEVKTAKSNDLVTFNKIYYFANTLLVLLNAQSGSGKSLRNNAVNLNLNFLFPREMYLKRSNPEINKVYYLAVGTIVWSKNAIIYNVEQEQVDELISSENPNLILNSWNRERKSVPPILEAPPSPEKPDELWPLPFSFPI
ncbi:MAG: hypothetical protein H7A37_06845 [Chlamydiales bacterium]|nr:hypothetical protein [Chlamydiia bacterium]MCP5507999.1 hypothetical protein [Chlamydiales bacterium]